MTTKRERKVGLTRAVLAKLLDEHPDTEPTMMADALATFAYEDGWYEGRCISLQELARHLSDTARALLSTPTRQPAMAGALAVAFQTMSSAWYGAAREVYMPHEHLRGPLVEVLTKFFDRSQADNYA